MKIGDIVYIRGFNVFAEIIDMGKENWPETWYRTDMEGIRFASEMTEISSLRVLDGLIKNAAKDGTKLSVIEEMHIAKLRKKLKVKEYAEKLTDDYPWSYANSGMSKSLRDSNWKHLSKDK